MKNNRVSNTKKVIICALSGLTLGTVGATVGVLATQSNDINIKLDYNINAVQDQNQTVEKGTRVKDLKLEPVEGYEFKGWYKDEACTQRYLPTDIITADSTIFVKLEKVTYAVIFPTSEYYTINKKSSIVNYGESISFSITKLEGAMPQEPEVKVNGDVLTPDSNGVYIIMDITSNTVVTVDGIEPQLSTVSIIVDDNVYASVKVDKDTTFGDLKTNEEYTNAISMFTQENSCGFFADQELLTILNIEDNYVLDESLNIYTKMATLDELEISGTTAYIKADSTATEIVLPASVTNMRYKGNSADTYMQHIVLPTSWTIIDNQLFEDTGLKTVNIHNGIKEIGEYAFSMSGLERLVIKHNLEWLSINAFSDCSDLNYVYWNSNLSSSNSGGILFVRSFANTQETSQFIIGKDVEVFNETILFANQYFAGILQSPVNKLIYEKSEKAFVGQELNDIEKVNCGLFFSKNIIINDQNRFDSFNGKLFPMLHIVTMSSMGYIMSENFGTVYIKENIQGADNFTLGEYDLSEMGIPADVSATLTNGELVTEGEYAGYYKYVVDINVECQNRTVYINGDKLCDIKVGLEYVQSGEFDNPNNMGFWFILEDFYGINTDDIEGYYKDPEHTIPVDGSYMMEKEVKLYIKLKEGEN